MAAERPDAQIRAKDTQALFAAAPPRRFLADIGFDEIEPVETERLGDRAIVGHANLRLEGGSRRL